MHRFKLAGLLLVAALSAVGVKTVSAAPGPVIHELLATKLADVPGKEMLAITVEYPPGGSDAVHVHEAYAFVYVLEGSVVMGLRGGAEMTLGPGQTFHEVPGDVHTVSRNASSTKPAKFLVVFVKKTGADIVIPASR